MQQLVHAARVWPLDHETRRGPAVACMIVGGRAPAALCADLLADALVNDPWAPDMLAARTKFLYNSGQTAAGAASFAKLATVSHGWEWPR